MKKHVCEFYVKESCDPTEYGFVETIYGYVWKMSGIRSGLFIDKDTRRLTPTLNYCSANIEVMLKMAADNMIETKEI